MKKISLFILVILLSTSFLAAKVPVYPFDVKVTGQGEQAIVFIPGFASSGEVWKETLRIYERNYKCYTLTMAGFAGIPAQQEVSFSSWEKAIAAYVKSANVGKPILVGHSMGGALAMALAADYPDMWQQIVVVDAVPCLAAMMNPGFQSKVNNDCTAAVRYVTSVDEAQFLKMQRAAIGSLCADTSRLATIVEWSMKSDRRTFAEMYCDFSNTDLREKIAGIRCPALILLEAYFTNLQPQITAQYQKLTGANLQYATKGLHFIMYDDTEWYNNQLAKFIQP